ncbi:MAG TPA: hypothetical protein VM577_11465 [Anaerovoracaceae bacterium]|nr:hypothetical protein [Anaerovoracaceae bacterium]
MGELKDKAHAAYHLAKQLKASCDELFKEMTTAAQARQDEELTEFEFVKTVMHISALAEPLALDLKDVYLSLGLIAFTKRGFAEQVRRDIEESAGTRGDCNCSVCKAAAEEILSQVEEIVKKTNQK